MEGRVKLHRQIQDWPDWGSEPFTRGQARVDLVLLANHSEGSFYVRGNKITIKRGQVGWSEIRLSEKRHWSRNKLRRWLKELETIQQIEQHKSPILSVITIINYEKYQGNDTTDDTTERQQTIQQKDTNKNDKKKKEGKENYPPNFESFRLHFPHARKGKKQEAMNYYVVLVEQEVRRELDLLKLRIEIGEVDGKYIPACERRLRDFTPISKTIRTKSISLYRQLHKDDPKKEELYKWWIDNYPEQWKTGSEEFRKSQSINLSSFK